MTTEADRPRAAPSNRVYEKGERRFKHVGKGPEPVIEFDSSDPKKWVGKCPSTLSQSQRQQLLNEAIAVSNGDRELAVPKTLYVVNEGAIYEAQTSDHGQSYHAYPYKGKLSKSILLSMRDMAVQKDCVEAFDNWVKKYIDVHGAGK